jgi:hypothetical protein
LGYFDEPEELPVPEPELPPALPVPAPPLVLGEALEPLDEEPVPEEEPMLPEEEPVLPDVEPLAELCSLRQRSFSEPVRLSHCVLLPLALGEALVEPLVPLAEESLLEEPPTLCDDDCAIAAAENANSAAMVAVESVFNIVASPLWSSGMETAPGRTQAPCRQHGVSAERCCLENPGQ